MEFGKHIGKGLWGLAGKALPSVYGVGLILFVIRTFPPIEYGIFALLQTIYLLGTALAQSFALQPLVKYGAGEGDVSGQVSAAAALYAAFILPASALLLPAGGLVGGLFQSPEAGALLWYVPLMFLAAAPRNVVAYLLQAKLDLRTLFQLDGIFFLGSLTAIAVLVPAGIVADAAGVLAVNVAMLALSSAYGLAVVFPRYRVRPAIVREEVSRALSYGRYSLGASVSYSLYAQADNLIVSGVLGPVSLAVYNAAKIFIRGYEMLLQLIVTLLIPTVAKLDDAGKEGEKLVLAEKSLFLFTAGLGLISAALFGVAPFLLDLVYAGRYADSEGPLKILALSGILIPAIAVGSGYCFALGRMREVFLVNGAGSAFGILLLLAGTIWFGLAGAAWAVVAAYAAMAAAWLVVLRARAGVPVGVAGILSRAGDAPRFAARWLTRRGSPPAPRDGSAEEPGHDSRG